MRCSMGAAACRAADPYLRSNRVRVTQSATGVTTRLVSGIPIGEYDRKTGRPQWLTAAIYGCEVDPDEAIFGYSASRIPNRGSW